MLQKLIKNSAKNGLRTDMFGPKIAFQRPESLHSGSRGARTVGGAAENTWDVHWAARAALTNIMEANDLRTPSLFIHGLEKLR